MRVGKCKLERVYRLFRELFCHIFGPRLNHMFEQSLELLLRILKRFNAFQVLEWFSFLLRVNCVIFARAINADVWQAMVARAIESRKTLGSHLNRHFPLESIAENYLHVQPNNHKLELLKNMKKITSLKSSISSHRRFKVLIQMFAQKYFLLVPKRTGFGGSQTI